MRKWLVFLLVGALLLFQVGNVFAAEVFKGEYTRHTGKVWAYPGENVRFIVSNPNVAEEFRYKNGNIACASSSQEMWKSRRSSRIQGRNPSSTG